jgi:hypothetical protein
MKESISTHRPGKRRVPLDPNVGMCYRSNVCHLLHTSAGQRWSVSIGIHVDHDIKLGIAECCIDKDPGDPFRYPIFSPRFDDHFQDGCAIATLNY